MFLAIRLILEMSDFSPCFVSNAMNFWKIVLSLFMGNLMTRILSKSDRAISIWPFFVIMSM